MITAREAIELTKDGAREITVAYAGSLIDGFNWRNPVTIDAYGDCLVDRIGATSEDSFELNLAIQVVRRPRA